MALVVLMHAGLLLGLAGSAVPEPRAAPPAPAWRTAVRTIEAPAAPPGPAAGEPVPPRVAGQDRAPAPAPAPVPVPVPVPVPAAEPAHQQAPGPLAAAAAPPPEARSGPAAAEHPAAAGAAPASAPAAPAARDRIADTSPATPADADPVPSYRARLPPAFEALFSLRRGALAGRARWSFDTAADGGYTLALQSSALGRDLGHLRSQGQRAGDGLRPQRFVEGRGGRDRRAVNFEREAGGGGRIRFSGPDTELPLPPGVQDRLSWLLQLAAIVDAEPRLRERGAEVAMWVVGPRGDADVWIFVVGGAEAGGLLLRRAPRRPWDTEVVVWLDPSQHHLPLRAAWRQAGPDGGGEGAVELRRESLAWR